MSLEYFTGELWRGEEGSVKVVIQVKEFSLVQRSQREMCSQKQADRELSIDLKPELRLRGNHACPFHHAVLRNLHFILELTEDFPAVESENLMCILVS